MIGTQGQLSTRARRPRGADPFYARYTADGDRDPSFGGGDGWERLFTGDLPLDMARDSSGRYVVAGTLADSNIYLARITSSGSMDTTFGGGDGIVSTDLGGYDTSCSLALMPDGRAVIAGHRRHDYDLAVLRYEMASTRTERLYVQQDANYNVTSLTSVWGGVIERYLYESYGQRTVLNADWSLDSSTGDGLSDVDMENGFQGLTYDSISGKWYARNRIYDGDLGRWLQADHIGQYVDGMSLYEFVRSGPVGAVDSMGLKTSWWKAVFFPGAMLFEDELATRATAQGVVNGINGLQDIAIDTLNNPPVLPGAGARDLARLANINLPKIPSPDWSFRLFLKCESPTVHSASKQLGGTGWSLILPGVARGVRGALRGALRGVPKPPPVPTTAKPPPVPKPLAKPCPTQFSKASQWKAHSEAQGWKPQQTEGGPLKYVDENGTIRVTIKRGSPRAPGSEGPHVELRNANGERIRPDGTPVTRKSTDNHTPIEYDIND